MIIGAGKVGKSIGYLLKDRGYNILGFISKTLTSAKEGVDLLGGGIASVGYDKFIEEADLIIIATPDDIIEVVSKELLTVDQIKKSSTLIHLSGSLSSKVLCDEDLPCGRLSLHPLQAVAYVRSGIKDLPKAFFTLEGNDLGLTKGREIMKALGADYKVIESSDKAAYHASAVIASNYLVAIIDMAMKINKSLGIDEEEVLEGILNLSEGSLENIRSLGTQEALTGPIARGDFMTIKGHLEALGDILDDDEIELYKRLASYTGNLASRKGSLAKKDVESLKEILRKV